MIKNIVFDMGNVLRDYNPMYAIEAFVEDEADRELLYSTIFKSEEWLVRDAGGLSREEACAIWKSRLPVRLRGIVDTVGEKWCVYMPNFDDMTALVKRLHENGYPIYLFSNTSDYYEIFKDDIHALRYMQGAIVSYEHHVIKPDPRIYHVLFERYCLKPEECYFVDDSMPNIMTARELGMAAYCYKRDTDELIADMQKTGIRI